MSDRNITSTHFECSFNSDDLDSEMCPNIISRLQLLETESLALDTECLLQILEQCFSICTIESLEEQIFRKALPKAQHFLSRIVKAIDDIIMSKNVRMDDLDDVKQKLCICDGLLVFLRKCVEHVSTLKKVRVFYIKSLCEILPETIKIVFEHCKASRKYGMLLSGAMQELRNLFARAGAIFKLFFATLNGVIVFDTDVESETELLTKVIDAHGTIASIANGMDTKTFVELSEAFAKLAITFQNDMKPNNIVTHLARMAKDVTCLLSTIKDQKDKNAERNIVATMRLLKILEKLTAAYSAFLTYKAMLDLLELSTQMHGCSCLSLAKNGEKAISASSASFLDIILNHDDFKQAYFEYGTQIISNDQHTHQLNYHLLTIAIMKKLNSMPYKHHCIWSLGSDSILDAALTYIGYLEEEICVGELRLPGAYLIGERTRLIGIYEATLVPVCDLVSQIPPEGFHVLELLLLKHLLSGRFWSSLLSSDVWCFIGRLGNSQLCADHIKYLIKISAILVERRGSIEAIMVDNMIVRLYELLTENAKSTLLDSLIDLDMYRHAPILNLLIVKTKAFSLERLRRKLEDLPKAYSDLQEHPSTRNWKCLTQWTSTVNYNNNKDVIKALIKIWNFVEDAITECEGKQLDILTDLIIVLLDATHFESLQDDAFYAILTSIATSCVYLPPQGKIKICHLLRCVENLDDRKMRKVATILTQLFSLLLEDDSFWIRQETLEIFERVGHVCSEELITEIAKSLAKIPSISNVMQAYLSSRPYYVLKNFANAQDYLRYLSRAIRDRRNEHMCHEYNESEREEKIPRLETGEESHDIVVPILIQLDEPAEKLYKELMKVLEGRAVISDTVCTKLINVLEKIQQAYVK